MAKSIIQTERECCLCRIEAEKNGYYGGLKQTGLHKHHLIYGRFGAFRKKAERFGLWAYMCAERHHEHGPEAPHSNPEVDFALKKIAQEAFEKKYGHDRWMQEFGKNNLDKEGHGDGGLDG